MLVRIDDFPRYIKIISAPDVLVPSDCPNEARLEYLKSQQVQHAHGLNIVQATPGLLHFLKQHNIPYALGNTRKYPSGCGQDLIPPRNWFGTWTNSGATPLSRN